MRTGQRFLGLVSLCFVGLLSATASASVTFRIVTDADMSSPVFAGRTTGAEGDIFWQGGENDLDILDLPNVVESTIGQNTVGSSSITFSEFTTSRVRSYAVGETLYTGPIVFGINTVQSISRQVETQTLTNGFGPDSQSVLGLQTAIFAPNNTFSYQGLSSQNSTHEFMATTRHGYFITAGQDPAEVFSDAAQFANVDSLVTQQGVIDHFNFIVANLSRDDWQMLTVELVDFTAVQKPGVNSNIGDFSGLIFGTTYVSFDTDAVPKERTLVSAVLPASRSVQVGTPATFFAVMSNTDAAAATGCQVSLGTSLPGVFEYRLTDPQTNAIVGSPNEPFNLPAGGTQTLLLSVTPESEIAATDVPVDYRCDSTSEATTIVGVNTLLLSASNAAVPDIVGLTTVVDLVAPIGQTALFAVASLNLGITDNIRVSLDTGRAPIPANLSLCQTNSATGACDGDVLPEVTLNFSGQQAATFAIFVEPTGMIENNPSAHRIFIRFSDSAGTVRGATTTAVRTQ